MDPLSLTTAAISLSETLRDIIKVAYAVSDAVEKLRPSYENVRKLMDDVCETLEDMEATYDKNREIGWENSTSLKESMNSLVREMNYVHDQCAALIRPVKLKKRDKFMLAFYSPWKRQKVEKLVSELKTRVDMALRLFKHLSAMRIEGMTNEIDLAISEALAPTTLTVQNQYSHNMGSVSDPQLYLFAQAYATPMNWLPETIPVDDLSKAYLRHELANLDKALQSLSSKWFENPKADIEIPPLKVTFTLNRPPSANAAVHRDAIIQTFTIQTLLESPDDSWTHKVNIGLSHLATTLSELDMYEEAISMSTLRFDLCTAAAKLFPNSFASEHVVAALTDLSLYFHNAGNKRRSHITSEEAVKRINIILDNTSNKDEMHALLARILSVEAENHPSAYMALRQAESSVQKIEDTLGIHNTTFNHMPSNTTVENEFNNKVMAAINRQVSSDLLFTYASTLYNLSRIQKRNELLLAASGSAKQSMIVLLHLVAFHPHSAKILHQITNLINHICSPELYHLNTITEKSEYLQTSVDTLMQLASADPQKWVSRLVPALFARRSHLLSTGDVSEAQESHQQILGLSSMVVDYHANLKIPSETEADYYSKLAIYHQACKRIPDAISAAKNAISQYAALEYITPGRTPDKHFNMLAFLSGNLTAMQQHDSALAEGFKALQLVDSSSMQGHDLAILKNHMELLDNMMVALDESYDTRTLELARDIISRIKTLFLISGRKLELTNITQAPIRYVSILQKNDLYEEAVRYLRDVRASWESTYGETAQRSMIAFSYLRCLMTLPNIYKAKGEIQRALYYSQEAMDVAEELFSDGFHILKSLLYLNMSSTHIYLLCDAGRYDEALALSELVVAFARENNEANHSVHGLVQALGGQTFCQLYSNQPDAAIATSSEAIELCKKALSNQGGPLDTESNILSFLYVSFMNLADGLGDVGDIRNALINLQEAHDTLVNQEIVANEEVGSDVHSYIVLSTKKSRLLFAQGDYTEAVKLIQEVIHKERNRINLKLSVASSLLKSLRYAGILYCTLGRHSDGIAAVTEMTTLMDNVRTYYPSVARLVTVEMHRLATRGLWNSVKIAQDNLKCYHQDYTDLIW